MYVYVYVYLYLHLHLHLYFYMYSWACVCARACSEMGVSDLRTLYRIADKDGNGNIDFNEFLVAVVGNLVSI